MHSNFISVSLTNSSVNNFLIPLIYVSVSAGCLVLIGLARNVCFYAKCGTIGKFLLKGLFKLDFFVTFSLWIRFFGFFMWCSF